MCVVTESGLRFYLCLIENHLQLSVVRPSPSAQLSLRNMWVVGSSLLALDSEMLISIIREHLDPAQYTEMKWDSSLDMVLNVCPMESHSEWKERRTDGSDYLFAGINGVLFEISEPSFLVIEPDSVWCLHRRLVQEDYAEVGFFKVHNR